MLNDKGEIMTRSQSKIMNDLKYWCESADFWLSQYKAEADKERRESYRLDFYRALDRVAEFLGELEQHGIETECFLESLSPYIARETCQR